MKHLIAPSILSADFLNLNSEINMINDSVADLIHVDIMDGMFVPNITFGMPVLAQIKKIARKPLDVHLMIVDPDRYIEHFKKAGADLLSVHIEACNHLHRSIQYIKNNEMKAGVVVNPHTNIILLKDIISELDHVCLMSVNPGFGGQSFIKNTLRKIEDLKKMIVASNSHALIEVDGGVDNTNAKELVAAGADILVSGNYIFKSKSPKDTIKQLKELKC